MFTKNFQFIRFYVYVSTQLPKFRDNKIPESNLTSVTISMHLGQIISVQFSSVTQSCLTLCDPTTPRGVARQASLSITNSRSLLKLRSIELVMPSNHLILCSPLLLPPLVFPSIRVFSNEAFLHIRWPKYWSFSSNEYSGLSSFRMDWLDFLAVQGTLI